MRIVYKCNGDLWKFMGSIDPYEIGYLCFNILYPAPDPTFSSFFHF